MAMSLVDLETGEIKGKYRTEDEQLDKVGFDLFAAGMIVLGLIVQLGGIVSLIIAIWLVHFRLGLIAVLVMLLSAGWLKGVAAMSDREEESRNSD